MLTARRCFLIFAGMTLAAASAVAQAAPSGTGDTAYSVPTNGGWTDTGLDLHSGDRLQISASEESSVVPDRHAVPGSGPCDPKGVTTPDTAGLPLASAARGALIAKLHEGDTPVLIGAGKEVQVDAASHLFLGVNVAGEAVCHGAFKVVVHRTGSAAASSTPAATTPTPQAQSVAPSSSASAPASATSTPEKTDAPAKSRGEQLKSQLASAAQIFMQGQFGVSKAGTTTGTSSNATAGDAAASTSAAPPLKVSDSPLDPELRKLIESLPRRVNDQLQNLGDMVNFVIIGSQTDAQAALEAANWHVADTDHQKAVLSAVLQTYEKKDYLQMPMSTLYLFGRPQDFGYEQAEPIAMVASRHHFRIWKAPFTWKQKEVWVGAGTHDIGFAKDRRNGSVTHKIDPAVDGERENIGSSLEKTGKVKTFNYYLPSNAVQEARNATGDSYHSDGRLLVITLQ